MSCQSKATQISLLLHAFLILGGLLLSRYATTPTPPLVIDFSIAVAEAASGEPGASPAPEQQKMPVHAPPDQAERVVPKKEMPKNPAVSKRLQKKHASPARRTAEAVKQEAQPAVDQTKEQPPLPAVIERQEASSEALSAGGTPSPQANDGEAIPAAGGVIRQDQKSAGIGPQGGEGEGGGTNTHSNFEYIRNLILKNLTFPATARNRGLTGKIVVSFLLKEDGQVENIAIISGSGHEILDSNVVATIRRIAPFPKPPARAQLVLPIVYHLK